MKKILIILISSIIACACKKDKLAPPTISSCDEFVTEPALNQDTFFTMGCPVSVEIVFINKYNYERPVFNPNNLNQIAYTKKDTDIAGWNTELWTFDFCTKKTKYLTDKVGYGIDWSTKDWLIFTGKDQQIWKIKSNGDSLIQLTNQSGYNNHPNWNDQGTHFIYSYESDLLIADEFGVIDDTIRNFYASPCHWKSNYLTAASGTYIRIYDFTNESEFALDPVSAINSNHQLINTSYSVKNDLVYWNNQSAIGYSNVKADEQVVLHRGATNRYYIGMDISSDNKTFLVARGNSNKINDCLLEVETSLYLIDIDGNNERKILIPE